MSTNKSIDWNDTNVLRTLSDSWYTVPLDSEYARSMMRHPREEDTRDLAEKRYQKGLEIERNKRCGKCMHLQHIKEKGFWICLECGLCERGPSQCVSEEGYEDRVLFQRDTDELHNKVRDIFEDLILELSCPLITVENSLDRLLETCESYVLPNDTVVKEGKRKHPFRVSARPEGLCAVLIWREVLIQNLQFTMSEFSRKIDVKRVTILAAFKQLDDYDDLHVSKPGRPKKIKKKLLD